MHRTSVTPQLVAAVAISSLLADISAHPNATLQGRALNREILHGITDDALAHIDRKLVLHDR